MKPDYLSKLIRMQSDDELYIAKGTVGYKHALKYLEKNNWQIDGVKFERGYGFETRDTVIRTERPIDKLKRIIDFKQLKKGTLEKSCIDNELYLIDKYGIYYNGVGEWYFGLFKREEVYEKKWYDDEYKLKNYYKVPKREKLTNQNYKVLIEEKI